MDVLHDKADKQALEKEFGAEIVLKAGKRNAWRYFQLCICMAATSLWKRKSRRR